jgi:hypothetical protein
MGRRLTVLALFGLLAVALPAAASDSFRDVGTSSPHHEAVRDLADAGITQGCRPGEYCPRDSVRRDQMASFLSRALPRSGFADGPADLVADNDWAGVPATASVRMPGDSGGRGTVVLHGTVTVYSEADVSDACPCEVEAFVYRADGQQQGPSSWAQLPADPTASGRVNVALPVSWAVDLPSGRSEQFGIAVFVNDGEPEGTRAEGSLAAVTAPFGDVPRG